MNNINNNNKKSKNNNNNSNNNNNMDNTTTAKVSGVYVNVFVCVLIFIVICGWVFWKI